jgi:transposase
MTTLGASPEEVLEIYRSRDAVERAFRITKETIKIRPVWNRTEEHIKAHLFVCFIAYLLYSLLEIKARKQIAGITGVKMLDKLKILTRRAERDIDTGEVEEVLSGMVDES